MGEVVHLGVDHRHGRQLFVVDAPSPTAVRSLLPEGHSFVALVAWNAEHASVDSIGELAEDLLKAGCVYVCCWGQDCERVHDVVDEVAIEHNPDGPLIMTTWHAEGRLEDALCFMLFSTEPVEELRGQCTAAVAVSVGSQTWASTIRYAMLDTRSFERSSGETNDRRRGSAAQQDDGD